MINKSTTAMMSRAHKVRKTRKKPTSAASIGVIVGQLVGLDKSGAALVDFPGNTNGSLLALTTIALTNEDISRQVVLQFIEGDLRRPVILGLIKPTGKGPVNPKPITAKVDGERLTISAAEEIVLECGKASISLTRDGKVAIRGTYLLSRSSGVNRIQGGSIQLN